MIAVDNQNFLNGTSTLGKCKRAFRKVLRSVHTSPFLVSKQSPCFKLWKKNGLPVGKDWMPRAELP